MYKLFAPLSTLGGGDAVMAWKDGLLPSDLCKGDKRSDHWYDKCN